MPSPQLDLYQTSLSAALQALADDPDREREIFNYADAVMLLWHLDLEPARPVLEAGYAGDRRSADRWDPVVMLRCLLLAGLVGLPDPNRFAARLRSSPVLRALGGVQTPPEGSRRAPSPSVGSIYDFMHRLHDGKRHTGVSGEERASDVERRAAKTPRPPWHARPDLDGDEDRKPQSSQRKKKKRTGRGKPGPRGSRGKRQSKNNGAAAAIAAVTAVEDLANPDDLTQRLLEILWQCGVLPSADKGLLGDVSALITCGDGSPLETNASGLGHKLCPCSRRDRCSCDRHFADPDATRGYDSYRKKYFFGHWWYELAVGSEGHDLPLGLELFPAHFTDYHASIKVTERLHKHIRDHTDDWHMAVHVADSGEDGAANHAYLRSRGIRPVIATGGNLPAVHPDRPELKLSKRGIPMCQAEVEMKSWGRGGPGRRSAGPPQFVCPVKGGKLDRCPLAPDDDPHWVCQPGTRFGPTVNLNTKRHPRLFPEISRNSPQFHQLYAQRTACERSNAVKKKTLGIDNCGHRRHSFWLIRLYVAALTQHAKAWVAGADAKAWLTELIETRALPPPVQQAA